MIKRPGDIFQERYGRAPLLCSAPGRINLIGEHTDYNEGFVLPAAINLHVYLAIGKAGKPGYCRLYAVDFDDSHECALADIAPGAMSGWPSYVLGVAGELRRAGHAVEAFDCVFSGDLPLGAGLSSSAALECAAAVGMNALFALGLDPPTLARHAQAAEHHYAGVRCGIMDQFASMMGRADAAILLDCRDLNYQYVPLELGDFALALCDTQVKHALAVSEYNTRRAECEESLARLRTAAPQLEALRDVSVDMLRRHRALLTDALFDRVWHVVSENIRTLEATEALRAGDMPRLGGLMYASHDSLRRLYQVSCPELDFLVDATHKMDYVAGARMMGGGFGGCTLNLVRRSELSRFSKDIASAYLHTFGQTPPVYLVRPGEGARIVPASP
jgi:galactokinase